VIQSMTSRGSSVRPPHIALLPTCLASLVAACTIRPKGSDGDGGGGAGGGTGGGGSAGAPGECAGKVVCDDCRACAVAGPCASELAACNQSAACVAIDQCLAVCGGITADCLELCASQNPAGVSLYDALLGCVDCGACLTPCGTAATCGG
jgi:hypothetical protein